MKQDSVIDELRPYLKEPANVSFFKTVHQKDVRELIEEVKKIKTDDNNGTTRTSQKRFGL